MGEGLGAGGVSTGCNVLFKRGENDAAAHSNFTIPTHWHTDTKQENIISTVVSLRSFLDPR